MNISKQEISSIRALLLSRTEDDDDGEDEPICILYSMGNPSCPVTVTMIDGILPRNE